MRFRNFSLATFLFLSLSGFAAAQDPFVEMYGRAVHSYFRGDRTNAAEILNEIISAGFNDPRAYYYRGLCNASYGDLQSAIPDFEQGAMLEVNAKTSIDIGRSLERIQGQARVEIEKARSRARLTARSQILEQQRAKLDMLRRSGESGLVVPPNGANMVAPGTTPAAPGAARLAPNDPFNTTPRRPAREEPETLPGEDTMDIAPPTMDPSPIDDVFGTGSAPANGNSSKPSDDPF